MIDNEMMSKDLTIRYLRSTLHEIHQESYNTQSGIAANALNQTDKLAVTNYRLAMLKDMIEMHDLHDDSEESFLDLLKRMIKTLES